MIRSFFGSGRLCNRYCGIAIIIAAVFCLAISPLFAEEKISAEPPVAQKETGSNPESETAAVGDETNDGPIEQIHSENPNAPDARVVIDNAAPEPVGEPEKESPVEEPLTMERTILNGEQSDAAQGVPDDDLPELESERVLSIGFPDAQKALKEMYDDVVAGINTRRLNGLYGMWKRYAASVLARTNRLATGLELNNRCRLSWYDRLYRDPASSVFYAEAFSRELYQNLASGAQGVARGIQQGRVKMDLVPSVPDSRRFTAVNSPEAAVRELSLALAQASNAQSRALAPLTPGEVRTITNESFTIFSAQMRVGHMVSISARAKYLIDLMEKMDRESIYDGIEALIPVTDSRFVEQLKKINPEMFETVVIGENTCRRFATPAGDVIIGGPEDNSWNLNSPELAQVACLIDLGGNDTYLEGTCNPDRPVLAVLDLGPGDDRFEGKQPGIQGGSILGISLLFNEQGNNIYRARDIAQGATIGGAGVLIDNNGDTEYLGFKRVQGCALCGLGLLIDRAGRDDYHAALLAQGLGNPRGFGVLVDKSGNDHYYVGGYYEDSYPEHPGYDGWGQGLGAGIRGVACGGIGALLEGEGDDVYEFDYFGHGGGYWEAIGFLRDFGGDDISIGATLKAYDGRSRSQARWQRFSNGFGCHYALGFLFDDAGNDSYNGTIMGLGMAWDLSGGFLVDFLGDDVYEASGGLTQGTGAEGSLGFLFDYRGVDNYKGRNQGYALPRLTYHTASDCGGNFSFVIDHGGQDQYGNGVSKNNMMSQRGTVGGFVIDRPTVAELAELNRKAIEAGEPPVEGISADPRAPLPIQRGTSDPGVERAMNQMTDTLNNRNAANEAPTGPWGARWGNRR